MSDTIKNTTDYYAVPAWDMNKYHIIDHQELSRNRNMFSIVLPDAAPIDGHIEDINIDIYSSHNKKPTIILHPILGGENKLAELFAKFFTYFFKWNAVVVHRVERPKGLPGSVERWLKSIVTNNIQVFQFLESKHNRFLHGFDRDTTACIGTSLGGITTALMTKFFPLKCFIIIMGGGNIPQLFAISEEMDGWIKEQMTVTNMTKDEYIEQLKLVVKTEPLDLVSKGENCLMMMSLFDKSIPYTNQKQLLEAFDVKPSFLRFPAGHYTMFLFLPILLICSWIYASYKLRK